MEREILFTGVGGQGVQLGAQVLARAAILEGREVMYLGVYGGTMRGGNTDVYLVVADEAIESPPIVASAWSAIAMHSQFFAPIRAELRPGAVLVRNASLFEGHEKEAEVLSAEVPGARLYDVPAAQIATDIGNALAASMVLVAAYAAVTGLVGDDALVAAMRESVPAYRTQHLETNERALRAGFAALPHRDAPAWREEDAA